MKKITYLFLFSVASIIASAQVSIKPHVGINFSNLTSDVIDYENPAVRIGWLLGAGVKIGEDFYVEPGVEWTYNTFELIHENDKNLDHVSAIKGLRVPVMVGYQFGSNDDLIRFRVFLGPTATFVLGVDSDNAMGVPQKDDVNSIMWAANGGVGLDILFTYVEVGYQLGLNNYYSNTADFGTGKQTVFWISVGVSLGN